MVSKSSFGSHYHTNHDRHADEGEIGPIPIPYLRHNDFHFDTIMKTHHSSRRHKRTSIILALFVFAWVFAESHGAFVSSPFSTTTTTKSVRVSPPSVVLFQATESETQDKEEASALAKLVTENKAPPPSNLVSKETSIVDGIQQGLQTNLRIIRDSQAQGYSFTQIMANVLAGDYDEKAISAKIDNFIQKSPCVMFTWERSPSCVKAVDAFQKMGILDQVNVVRLDDPWSEGNPVRAEIGKRVGRSSVPMIFIGGEYVGGFDGGLDNNDDNNNKALGIQTMAFQGTLRPKLEAAGIKLPSISPSS